MCTGRAKSSSGIRKISMSSQSMLSLRLEKHTSIPLSVEYNSPVELLVTGNMDTEFYMGTKTDGINSWQTNLSGTSEYRGTTSSSGRAWVTSQCIQTCRDYSEDVSPYIWSVQVLPSAFPIDCCERQDTEGNGPLVWHTIAIHMFL